MMNQDIKARWVEALRSGDYSQTKEVLKGAEGYCCLGVLCEIAVKDGIVIERDGVYISVEDESDFNHAELPDAVVEWAELPNYNPATTVDYTRPRPAERKALFSELNDDMDYDFNQIAEAIESDPEL